MTYVELHCHSAYSFLDGASLPEELAATALELGHQTLALTDHDGVYGSMEFAHAARGLGLRPIHGAEITLSGPPLRGAGPPSRGTTPFGGPSITGGRQAGSRHLTLLVAAECGWRNLCRLLTLAHANTRKITNWLDALPTGEAPPKRRPPRRKTRPLGQWTPRGYHRPTPEPEAGTAVGAEAAVGAETETGSDSGLPPHPL